MQPTIESAGADVTYPAKKNVNHDLWVLLIREFDTVYHQIHQMGHHHIDIESLGIEPE